MYVQILILLTYKQIYIHYILLFPGQIVITRLLEYKYEKFLSGAVGYSPDELPCHCVVTILQYISIMVVTAYPAI